MQARKVLEDLLQAGRFLLVLYAGLHFQTSITAVARHVESSHITILFIINK